MSIPVSTLVKYLKNKLDSDDKLQNVVVNGELSNFHKHSSGHLYFTLKDEKASISCVMFASRTSMLKFSPNNGDKVELSASVSIFEVSGQLQLYVNSMKKAGLGDLYQQYEELKNRLAKEGYFEQDHKKDIPNGYPEKIAVLVGDKSAAMSDIKTCFQRRWPLASVDYYPVLVQGDDAPKDIIKTLKDIDQKDYEIIILARGGGSFEDLFCFNDEALVKTIYKLNTFIINGVGHEQDFTLADFVADLRAPTPTAAVELITPNIIDIWLEIGLIKKNLMHYLQRNIENKEAKLDYLSTKLDNYINSFELLKNKIQTNKELLNTSIRHLLQTKEYLLQEKTKLISAYSLKETLKRGYALVYKDGKVIKSKDFVKCKDNIEIQWSDGSITAKVD